MTTATTTKEIKALEIEANELAAMEVPVEHNSGTFGASECCRATGSGDPKDGEYTVYARVGDGQRRVVGCDPANAPGYARHFGETLAARQKQLRCVRVKISALRKASR